MVLFHFKPSRASLEPALSIKITQLVGKHEAEFKYEVEGCIIDRLEVYVQDPGTTNLIISKFRLLDVFPHSLRAADRDTYLGLSNTLLMPNIYCGINYGRISG